MATGSRAGSRFGRYELRRLLGVGGMGEVYEAYDTSKNRTVALKLLDGESARDPVYVERFRRESLAAARLQEPHVIPVHDWGDIDGVLYIDMRLVEGRDLKERIAERGPLPPADAVAVIEQIAAALDAAHEAGLVHRDVKPANILLTRSSFAYLVDFGIAHSESDAQLTGVGDAVGSFAYMAPERFDETTPAPAIDIYSLTCVLYECLVGRVPFPAANFAVLITAHQVKAPPRPGEHSATLAAFDPVIARGMAKNPRERYRTAGEMAAATREALRRAEHDAHAARVATTRARPVPPPPTGPGSPRPGDSASGSSQPGNSVPPTPGAGRAPRFDGPVPPPHTAVSQQAGGPTPPRPTRVMPVPSPPTWTGAPGSGTGPSYPAAPTAPGRSGRGLPITVGVLAVAVLALAAVLVVWVVGDRSGTDAAAPPTTSVPRVTTTRGTTSVQETTRVTTRPSPTSSAASVPVMTGAVEGTDARGFLDGPRCEADHLAYFIGRTEWSLVVICWASIGEYYYRGHGLGSGNDIELGDARADGPRSYVVTNPSDGTRYIVTPTSLNISKDGNVIVDEPMIESAIR